jgi:hypothetical protein
MLFEEKIFECEKGADITPFDGSVLLLFTTKNLKNIWAGVYEFCCAIL